MKKYSQGFKLKVAKEYLDGLASQNGLAKKYNVSQSAVQSWVNKYRRGGVGALKKGTSDTPYSVQFKLNAVELYQTTDISYQKLADKLSVSSPSMIQRWVKQYDAKGIEGISRTRSPKNRMTKEENNRKRKSSLDGLTKEEIEEKVLRLEIENAYLKELRSLQNKEKRSSKTKKKRD